MASSETAALSHGSIRLLHRFATPGPGPGFWVPAWALTGAAVFGALAPVLFRHVPFAPIDVVFRLVGGSFAACGLVAWRRRPDSRVGPLMTATGVAFFVSPLLGQLSSPMALTAAAWLPDLWVVFMVALLLTFTSGGRLRTRVDRVLVGAVAFEVAVLAPLWLMFSEHDGNLLLVTPAPRVSAIVDTVQRSVLAAVPLATTAVVGRRFLRASPAGRRALLPALAGCGCLLLFAALLVVDLTTGERSQVLLWVAACSIAAVPVAFLVGLLRSRLARGMLADLFRDLRTMRPPQLQAELVRLLGDPGLTIAYPAADGLLHDTAGRRVVPPAPDEGRSVLPVLRDGRPVAVLLHDSSFDDDPELLDAVGGAAMLARENSDLHSQLEQRLQELQASRERILTAADAERRRIERNLHDGAQQRLVTVALQLTLLRRTVRDDPDEAEALAAAAAAELAASIDELRELARGIHPAALEQGLVVALESLVVRAAVPTVLDAEPGPEPPEPVALAAYFVAAEALTNVARYAHASSVTITLRHHDSEVVVTIADDGVGGADPAAGTGLRGLADRVEAAGGRLRVGPGTGGGTVVEARLPLRAAPQDRGDREKHSTNGS